MKKRETPSGSSETHRAHEQDTREPNSRSDERAAKALSGTTPCDHADYEEFIEPERPQARGRKRNRRIIAICAQCNAIATRLWMNPLDSRWDASFGWIWPDMEEAYRKWKKRQVWGGRR